MLCEVCIKCFRETEQFIESETKDQVILRHHRRSASLVESGKQCCFICRPFWDELFETEKQKLQELEQERDEQERALGVDEADLTGFLTRCTIARHSGQSYFVSFKFNEEFLDYGLVKNAKTIAYASYGFQPEDSVTSRCVNVQSASTSSDETMQKVKGWIEMCLSEHTVCHSHRSSTPWYPTRLVHVNPSTNTDVVRLVESASAQPKGPYLTLSHRWGESQMTRLLKENIAAFRCEISVSSLPRTFRDAVDVARKLGVDYIWIDSLCIIQDDDGMADWLRESAFMHEVYSQSHLNISASASRDSSEGLYRDREPSLLESTHVDFRAGIFKRKKGRDPMSEKVQRIIKYEVVNVVFWTDNISYSPINTRGWVFQERLLAPRVLHFGPDQVYWECHETDACEFYPKGVPEMVRQLGTPNFKAIDLPTYHTTVTTLGSGRSQPKEKFTDLAQYEMWKRLLTAYSRTILTLPSDKSIAISGIAKRFRNIFNDEYIAGMWRKDLEMQMLWKVNLDHENGRYSPGRSAEYRAPSWSWLSVDGRITSADEPGDLLFSVIDVNLEYKTNDSTGIITGGYLDMKCHLTPFTFHFSPHLKPELHVGSRAAGLTSVRSPSADEDKDKGLGLNVFFDSEVFLDNYSYFDPYSEAFDAEFFCVPVLGNTKYLATVEYFMLALVDREEGVYRRVGMCLSDDEVDKEVLGLGAERPEDVPCRSYEDGWYVVRVV